MNIAFNKPAYQSSTYTTYTSYSKVVHEASYATNGLLYGGENEEFSHTNDHNAWWMVDLEGIYSISEIYLYNRYSSYHSKSVTCQSQPFSNEKLI